MLASGRLFGVAVGRLRRQAHDGDAVVRAVGDVERAAVGAEGDGVAAAAERQPALGPALDRFDDFIRLRCR